VDRFLSSRAVADEIEAQPKPLLRAASTNRICLWEGPRAPDRAVPERVVMAWPELGRAVNADSLQACT